MQNKGISVTTKQILKLAAPISLAILIPQISFFTNTVFLGKLGERELGINGITGVFYLILSMMGYGLSNGVQVQMSRRNGEGNRNGLAQIFANSILLTLLLAFVLMLLCLWCIPLIFGYSLHNYNNFPLVVSFLYLRIWGLPFLFLTQLFSAFFISIGRSKVLIYGSFVATILNIVFDYGLIFGKLGMPNMGFSGAALASVISEVFYFVTLAGIFVYSKFYVRYPIFNYGRLDMELSQGTLKVALPLVIQLIFSIGGWLIFFLFIEHLGSQSLAASQILRNIFGIVGVGIWALATTCNTIVSNTIGMGRQNEVPGIILKIIKLSLTYTFGVCVLLLLFSKEFLGIYTGDISLIEFSLPSLRVIVIATLTMAASSIVFNGVLGTGNTLVNLTLEVTCVFLYLIYCYFMISKMHSALYICWGSEFVYWLSLLVGSIIYLKSGRWKGKSV